MELETKELHITGCEDREAETGAKYTRFKTNLGNMNAFDKEVIDELKKNIGKVVKVKVATNDKWKNIREYVGVSEDQAIPEEAVPLKGVDKPRVPDGNATMWGSYVKDIFIALVNEKVLIDDAKREAIEAMLAAKEAFE